MAAPVYSPAGSGVPQQGPSPAAAAGEDNSGVIPQRLMRVKVLYTFDDQNKSNCLARLPNAVNIPVAVLDGTTQVGVIPLKTCLHAIVSASPELVAKLGHDYTVYAYDFSEYDTPMVGQGLLSWILASASPTPNAPAFNSESMVTGRVCNNILGLFSNGVKETLEVKLKLVPVPTCMQKEYVENMERYHSLSQLMPGDFDYAAWSEFMKENPTIGSLARPTPQPVIETSQRASFGGIESFHDLLTRQSPSQEPPRTDSFYDQANASFYSQPTRASSPAMSAASFHNYHNDSRPASRASIRSEGSHQLQHSASGDSSAVELQEEGPAKKRARIMEAKRPRNTPLLARNDSLRVTASTAASVRLHRPILSNPAVGADLVPRAPTPRPGEKIHGSQAQRRLPAPSALRHASMDGGRPYMSPYDTANMSDQAVESPEERNDSPEENLEMPSSPPVAQRPTVSPVPSSPPLPTIPLLADSGFVSDVSLSRDEYGPAYNSDVPLEAEVSAGSRSYKSRQGWQTVNPGPLERLPHSYIPKPKQHYRKHPVQSVAQSIENDDLASLAHVQREQQQRERQAEVPGPPAVPGAHQSHLRADGRSMPTDSFPFGPIPVDQPQDLMAVTTAKHESPEGGASHVSPSAESEIHVYSRSATPNIPPKQNKTGRTRGLPRSNTWSGVGEPMSDAPTASEQRSGSGAKRKKYIKEKLEQALAAGEMPPHCVNCGEIDTPTWRKAYTRVEYGSPVGLEVSTITTGTDVIAFEIIEPVSEHDKEQKYRVFKNNVTPEEKTMNSYEPLNLCNPCGLWLIKKGSMRPQRQWDKSARQLKRKRMEAIDGRAMSMSQGHEIVAETAVPMSDADAGDQNGLTQVAAGSVEGSMPPPPMLERAATVQGLEAVAGPSQSVAEAAFQRAIQSSPAGVRGSKASPIDLDPDLTPRPTRRLLFPSPRKDGETKTLAAPPIIPPVSTPAGDDDAPQKPRCQRCKQLKKACNRERPCGRCVHAEIGYDGCIPCEQPRTNWFPQPIEFIKAAEEEENPDKENCPPGSAREHDEFADLFEDAVSPKTTPKKDALIQDFLKTPTPSSRRRAALTPRRGTDDNDLLKTPTRNIFTPGMTTPRSARAATIAPETPFTRQLNAFLSDHPISSPHNIDFTAFPTFNTPGRKGTAFTDFMHDDFMSSDMPMPSSPPKSGALDLGFDLYEDPSTASMGLWAGGAMFDGDALMSDMTNDPEGTATLLKMSVAGVTMDFAAMIEEVVSTAAEDAADEAKQPTASPENDSPQEQSVGVGATLEEPCVG